MRTAWLLPLQKIFVFMMTSFMKDTQVPTQCGSVLPEERIAAMIENKRDLLDTVVQEDDPSLSKLFDRSQLLELLRDI